METKHSVAWKKDVSEMEHSKKKDESPMDKKPSLMAERQSEMERRKSVGKKKGASGRVILLKNLDNDNELFVDSLHLKAIKENHSRLSCTAHRCLGSLMLDTIAGFPNKAPRSREDTLQQALEFIHEYYGSDNRLYAEAHLERINHVTSSIKTTGTYEMTYEELCYGSKTAWRNAPRCVGRIQWSKLEVFDGRKVKSTKDMFKFVLNHLKYATNGGNLRSAITIFPPRKFGTLLNDFKVWNSTILGYAGYRQPDGTIIGDPKGEELTEIAIKLGWKPPKVRGYFDMLPMVLQFNGEDPEIFDIPPECALEVQIFHPSYPSFKQLGLKWIAVPGVSNMVFDCGGLEYTGNPFSGWYMSTEIATRDLLDKGRYNLLKESAEAFGIQQGGNSTLWKDKVNIEANIAVIESFKAAGVTITDHHSASESFMKHLDNEQKLRGGCPADWVWVVPPVSGSLTEVYHQEMLNYKLRPSYEYQEIAWRLHQWRKPKNIALFGRNNIKHTLKGTGIALLFSAILIKNHLGKREQCIVLYASETGRSEMFARKLTEVCNYAFNTTVMCMDDYDVKVELFREKLLLVVAATTGNGDAPVNGQNFFTTTKDMLKTQAMVKRQNYHRKQSLALQSNIKLPRRKLSRLLCCSSVKNHNILPEKQLPDYVRLKHSSTFDGSYSVFGLGSKAYPNFCAFATDVDDVLEHLGGDALNPIGKACEIEGQDEPFKNWVIEAFTEACRRFGIEDSTKNQAIASLGTVVGSFKPGAFRLRTLDTNKPNLIDGLSIVHGKSVQISYIKEKRNLQPEDWTHQTIMMSLTHNNNSEHFHYVPGDHIAVIPANDDVLVERILEKLVDCPENDEPFVIEMQEEKDGDIEWTSLSRLPPTTIFQALKYYVDINAPPSQALLAQLVSLAEDHSEKVQLTTLSTDNDEYTRWKYFHWPNLAEMLDLFPSLQIPAILLLTQLPILGLRYYSISSAPEHNPGQIDITLGVVNYKTPAGKMHTGVCSNYVLQAKIGDAVPCFLRESNSFHMPEDTQIPIVMVGTGTGIAPFRSFWLQRSFDMKHKDNSYGPIQLYFGCRTSTDELYSNELKDMVQEDAITEIFSALSREPKVPKKYVQHYLLKNKNEIYNILTEQNGHFYVCGGVALAQDVKNVLLQILQEEGGMIDDEAQEFFERLKANMRYHEDIFGLIHRQPETKPSNTNGDAKTNI